MQAGSPTVKAMICPASDYRRSLALGASPGDAHHQFNSPPEACSDRSQPGGPLDSDVLVDIEQLRSKIKDGSSNEANITWAPTPQHSPAQKASTQHPSRFTLKPYLPAISHAPTYHSRRVTGSSSDGVQIEVSGTAARSSYGAHMSASGRPPFRPQSGNAPPQLAEVEPAACRSTSGKAPERGLALIVSTDDHTDRTLHMMSMSSSASLGAHSYRCSSGDAGPWRLDSAPTCATQHPPANSHLTTQRSSVPSMPTRVRCLYLFLLKCVQLDGSQSRLWIWSLDNMPDCPSAMHVPLARVRSVWITRPPWHLF